MSSSCGSRSFSSSSPTCRAAVLLPLPLPLVCRCPPGDALSALFSQISEPLVLLRPLERFGSNRGTVGFVEAARGDSGLTRNLCSLDLDLCNKESLPLLSFLSFRAICLHLKRNKASWRELAASCLRCLLPQCLNYTQLVRETMMPRV
jgi:hypothetical protein